MTVITSVALPTVTATGNGEAWGLTGVSTYEPVGSASFSPGRITYGELILLSLASALQPPGTCSLAATPERASPETTM